MTTRRMDIVAVYNWLLSAQLYLRTVSASARNGYPGTRVPESLPVTRVPVQNPGGLSTPTEHPQK